MKKLVTSPKKGDTLIGRAERMRELGVKTTKRLPQDMLDEVVLNDENSVIQDENLIENSGQAEGNEI